MTTSHGTATTINTYKFSIGVDTESTYKYDKTGNGTEHTYTYDINERLKSATLTLHKDIISTNTYTYDKTDNITGIRGVSESLYNQKYTYDDMNRLTGASGMDTGGNSDDGSAFSSYVMTMSYNQMSSPQRYELTKMSQSDTKVTENEYLYSTESSNPHAPVQIGDMTYTYSASGNPLTIEGSKISRSLTWDSENRLRELTDQRQGIQSRYTYNHIGERSLKRYGAYESMAVNGAAAGSLLDPKSAYSAYVSPYYVEHGRGTESGAVTKHYYAGAERLISKVVTSATGTKGESQNGSQSSVQTEESTYYYFTDHLGSTTYITDRSGRTSQYAAYTPYGELFREYKKVLPYKFNGKELDQETGYYYYGARYYDPSTALWFGVDPLASKYPMNSPYIYCNGNPVRFIDIYGCGPAERVKAARDMTGIAYKQETTKELRTAKTDDAMEYMDCSEFVCRVMEADNITPEVEHLTSGGIYNKLSTSDDFESSLTNPQVGDIAVWEGHVGIVTETNGEKFRMAHARGVGKLSAENGSFISKEQYRSSQFLGFFRPVDTLIDGGELNTIIVQGKSGTPKISIPAIKIDFSRSNKSMNFNIKIQNE